VEVGLLLLQKQGERKCPLHGGILPLHGVSRALRQSRQFEPLCASGNVFTFHCRRNAVCRNRSSGISDAILPNPSAVEAMPVLSPVAATCLAGGPRDNGSRRSELAWGSATAVLPRGVTMRSFLKPVPWFLIVSLMTAPARADKKVFHTPKLGTNLGVWRPCRGRPA